MHALTIFISAFLLFLVQPIISKQILPTFGGSSAVWLISLVFFQTLLLLGYFYSHLIVTYLKIKNRIIFHIFLLLASLFSLPIWAGENSFYSNPYLNILSILTVTVGIPYFMLSTTAPLVQALFSEKNKHLNSKAYQLYALSNVACLLALFSYPFVFEPIFSLQSQSKYWSVFYGLFVLVSILLLALSFFRLKKEVIILEENKTHLKTINFDKKIKWIFYAFLASSLLSAITSHITQNIASIPLFWTIPLAIYLISFIIAFHYEQFFDKKFLEIALLFIIPAMSFFSYFILDKNGVVHDTISIQISAFLFLSGLFISCLYLNGLIYKIKPDTRQLTQFYVYLSAGGALGAFFVAIVCPIIFNSYIEMPLLFIFLIGLVVSQFQNKKIPMVIFYITLFINIYIDIEKSKNTIDGKRGFYGVVSIEEDADKDEKFSTRYMLHGSILHGMQLLNHPSENTPTTYYHLKTGLGQIITEIQKTNASIHMGMVGMGVGTVAAYGREKDKITFFEIDPIVVGIAQKHFTYIKKSKADVNYKIGDGRALIKNEKKDYDILAIDAFSGDAVPVHLMTSQAVDMYLSKLKNDNGILAFHTSSSYINLDLPLAKIAQDKNLFYGIIESPSDKFLQTKAKWLFISKSKLPDLPYSYISPEIIINKSLWTDNYSNLVEVFN